MHNISSCIFKFIFFFEVINCVIAPFRFVMLLNQRKQSIKKITACKTTEKKIKTKQKIQKATDSKKRRPITQSNYLLRRHTPIYKMTS